MAFNLNNASTLMGWNQLVQIIFDSNSAINYTGGSTQILRVESYNIGVSQTSESPDYVTGRQDRTAWKKGPITSEGDISYPFTLTTGIDMFRTAAHLVKAPSSSFAIESSAHPKMSGCKINTSELSCSAENEVKAQSKIWGIVDEEEIKSIHSYGNGSRTHWGPGGISLEGKSIGESNYGGVVNGVDTTSLKLEQIPMFDVCSVLGAPEGMFIVEFSIQIDNQLKRMYTMGNGDNGDAAYSPLGLNATTISANQRKVTGTITWQSDYSGKLSQIMGSGIEELIIRIANYQFRLKNALWMAEPPTLSAGDRVVCQSSFIALGSGEEEGDDAFDALIIEDNDQSLL